MSKQTTRAAAAPGPPAPTLPAELQAVGTAWLDRRILTYRRTEPEPVVMRSSKAPAAIALGVLALATAPVLAGLIPALAGLYLIASGEQELAASQGWLSGERQLRVARWLCWLAIAVVIAAALWWATRAILTGLHVARSNSYDYPDGVN